MGISVLVVDDNTIYLTGIAALIRAQPDMELMGTAHTGREGIALYLKTRPDVTLIDLDLPDRAGIELLRQIRGSDPEARVIGLAMYELDAVGVAALAAGAGAIVGKDQAAETLLPLIRARRK